ncbi:MAG TPA: TonB C-terminal domain-containing protein [Allosphingosinicella sp.]|jgi:outer membrane biosynthesis protein TonB
MDRAEAAGLGVATAGHAALLVALSLGFAATRLPTPKSDPIEVSFVEEVGLESSSPTPQAPQPAPAAAAEALPAAPAMPVPPQIQPVAQPEPAARTPAPAPRPAPRRVVQPKPSPAPTRPSPAPSRSASKPTPARKPFSVNIPDAAEGDGKSDSATPPAAAVSAAAQASLGAEVRRQLKPHWKAPTGADAEQLRTEVVISLGRDGRVADVRVVGTTGQTASNRPQVPLHQEHAVRAVRLASPFRLPAQFYEAWKQLRVTFDKRLSQ